MAKKEKRFLGDLDAATDNQFGHHFVESAELLRIRTCQSDIIYGSKGVGKTALRRALTELNKDHYFSAKTIDLDEISFAQVHDALSKLKDTSKTEIPTLARNTWRNVLSMYCLEAAATGLSDNPDLAGRISSFLSKEGFCSPSSNNRLISQIERFFERIAEAGLDDDKPTPLSLNDKQRRVVNEFPSSPQVLDLLSECAAAIQTANCAVLVCLDGFDSIIDHTPESRRAIFAGLIDAIHKSSKDKNLARAFCFKAFLPQELADTASSVVWDADKYIFQTHYLRWSYADFQKLLLRRLRPYAKTRSAAFLDIWHEFMPDKIRNDIYKVDEPSFDYFLRHTLYRPRQLLSHVQKTLDRWDEKSDAFRVDPTFIPQVLADTNYELAKSTVNQLEITYPGLSAFMQSWNGMPNTMTVQAFQDRISKIFGCPSSKEQNDIFSGLFNFGIFGIEPKGTPFKSGPRAQFKFSFVGDRIMRSIHSSVESSDMVALSPMFQEYCGCTPSDHGVVIPIAM